MIDEALARDPADASALTGRSLLLAMKGRHAEALAMLQPVRPGAALSRTFHHSAYHRACIYALGNESEAAVGWLRQTVRAGMPIYPAFARDTCFDPIRRSALFTAFMSELKPVWDEYHRRMQ